MKNKTACYNSLTIYCFEIKPTNTPSLGTQIEIVHFTLLARPTDLSLNTTMCKNTPYGKLSYPFVFIADLHARANASVAPYPKKMW